jgi:5'-nucleotidase / UDP-sugar diphosphatase
VCCVITCPTSYIISSWRTCTEYCQSEFSLRIIHVNDHHSYIEPDTVVIPIDNTFPASLQGNATVPVKIGGWPLLTAAIDNAEQEGKHMGMDSIKLHAGDAITGTIFFTLFQGLSDAFFMNSVCFDAYELGNHEFDGGDSGLALFLDFLDGANNTNPGRCPKTPALAANVVPGPDSPLVGRLSPFKIFNYKGTKVGVIGIEIRNKTLQSSFPDPETDILDEATVATVQIAALKQQGVDIIILLTHVGVDNDLNILAKLPGVDVVVGGDSHTFMGYTPPVLIQEKRFEYAGT